MKALHGCVKSSNPVPSRPSTPDQIPSSSGQPLMELASSPASKALRKSTTEQESSSTSPFQNQLQHSISSSNLETFQHQNQETALSQNQSNAFSHLPVLEHTTFGDICQGPGGEVVLPPGMLESILAKQSPFYHLAHELKVLKDHMYRTFQTSGTIYSPEQFRQFCIDSGAPNIFDAIRNLTSSERRKERRKLELEKLTMNIIYTLCYGLSQRCNFLQKDFSAFLLSENLNRPALNTARKLGVTCTGETGRVQEATSIAAYEMEVDEIINRAITEGPFIIVIIDDFTTIHSHRRPGSVETSNAKCMCTIVLRVFPNIPAIQMDPNVNHLDPDIVSPQLLARELTSNEYMQALSSTYADAMPEELRSQFFHPGTVRERLATHQYKESDNVRKIRRLDNMYLLEFQECKLKNIDGYKTALDLLFRTRV